jgi:hypothetical protein
MSCSRIVRDFVQGDTPTWSITVYTDTAKTTTADTTDWKVWCTLKSDIDNTDANADLQVSSTMTSVNGALGLITVKPTVADSNALTHGTYFYDYQVLTNSGVMDTLEIGKVKVKQAVTLTSS